MGCTHGVKGGEQGCRGGQERGCRGAGGQGQRAAERSAVSGTGHTECGEDPPAYTLPAQHGSLSRNLAGASKFPSCLIGCLIAPGVCPGCVASLSSLMRQPPTHPKPLPPSLVRAPPPPPSLVVVCWLPNHCDCLLLSQVPMPTSDHLTHLERRDPKECFDPLYGASYESRRGRC